MLLDDCREFVRRVAQRRLPRRTLALLALFQPHFRVEEAVLLRGRQVERRPVGAQAPEIGRVVGVAAHAGDAPGFGLDQYAAADAAVGAGGGGFHGGKQSNPRADNDMEQTAVI